MTFTDIVSCPQVDKLKLNGVATTLYVNRLYIIIGFINGFIDIYTIDYSFIYQIKTS